MHHDEVLTYDLNMSLCVHFLKLLDLRIRHYQGDTDYRPYRRESVFLIGGGQSYGEFSLIIIDLRVVNSHKMVKKCCIPGCRGNYDAKIRYEFIGFPRMTKNEIGG